MLLFEILRVCIAGGANAAGPSQGGEFDLDSGELHEISRFSNSV